MKNQAVAIANLTWDSSASKQNVEQAAQTITSAIEKNTDKITATIKDGTKAISEATRKATTNESNNQPAPVAAIHRGLTSVASSATRIADYIAAHPSELKAGVDAATTVGKQFSELTDRASGYTQSATELQGAVAEVAKATDWVAGKFCGNGNVSVANFGRVVGSFDALR